MRYRSLCIERERKKNYPKRVLYIICCVYVRFHFYDKSKFVSMLVWRSVRWMLSTTVFQLSCYLSETIILYRFIFLCYSCVLNAKNFHNGQQFPFNAGCFFLFILNLNNNPSDETNTKCEQGRKIAENNHNHKINRNRTNKIQQQYYESSG